jgi:hypothetical protein
MTEWFLLIPGFLRAKVKSMRYVGVLAAIGNLLLVTILWRAIVGGMVRRYPIFYLYISFILASSAQQILIRAVYGFQSPQYYFAFHLPNLMGSLLLIGVLWDVYVRVLGNSKSSWRRLFGPAIVVSAVAVGSLLKVLAIPEAEPFLRFQAVALPVQVMVGLMVFHRLSSEVMPFELGRNLSGILLGTSIIIAPQAINFTSYLFLGESYEVFKFLLQFGYFLALAAYCFSLWEYAPMRRLDPSSYAQIAGADEKLQRVVKALLLNK